MLNLIFTKIMTPVTEKSEETTFHHIKRLSLARLLGLAITLLLSGIKWLEVGTFIIVVAKS
jgi:hypothetical protein